MAMGFSAFHSVSMKPLRAKSVPGDVAQWYSLGTRAASQCCCRDVRGWTPPYNLISVPYFFSKSHQDNLPAEMPRVKAYLGVFIPSCAFPWPGQSDLCHRCLTTALNVARDAVANLILLLCNEKICCAHRRIPQVKFTVCGVWEPWTVLLSTN